MNSHIEYSKELNFFAYKFITLSCDDFLISQESQKRVTISKMYYEEIKRIDVKVKTITIAVPKSGSSIISRKNTPMTNKIGNTPFFISSICF